MANTTGIKALDKLGRDARVQSIEKDEDGIWLYTATGFYSALDTSHTIHESSARAVIERAQYIEACDCKACQQQAERDKREAVVAERCKRLMRLMRK
jgi:hypothetical protein